jgi:hypothetical protein
MTEEREGDDGGREGDDGAAVHTESQSRGDRWNLVSSCVEAAEKTVKPQFLLAPWLRGSM